MNRRGFLAGAATVVAAAGGCITVSTAETTETHSYEIDDERVAVDADDADVTVRTEDRADVHVRAVKRDSMGNEDALSKLSVATTRSEGTFVVGVEDETDPGMADTTSLGLEVTVPVSNRVSDVTVADGNVDLHGTVGDLTVDAGDGDVSLRSVDGAVTVEAEDGDLTVDSVSGDATATVGDGDVTIDGIDGAVTLDGSDGDLTVTDPGAIDTVTGGDGDVSVEVPTLTDDATVSVGDGNLDLALSPDLDAALTLTVGDGDLNVTGFGFVRGDDVKRVETTLGDGTRTLDVSTGDGDVSVSKL